VVAVADLLTVLVRVETAEMAVVEEAQSAQLMVELV